MALHEQSLGATDEWYTPPHVFEALGEKFDLDVAHPGSPYADWVPTRAILTRSDDALARDWRGFLWMNPPFGGRNAIAAWLDRFIQHGDGIALCPDRTSAPWWQRYAPRADAALFVSPKIKFIGRDGAPGQSPAQGTTLLAIGARGVAALERAEMRRLGVVFDPHFKTGREARR